MNVHGVVADVTAPGEVERFVMRAPRRSEGSIWWSANVGGSAGLGLLESTPEDWETTFELNLFHAVRAIRAAVPHMQKRGGGSVVDDLLDLWVEARPEAQYGATKAGEIFLAGALAWSSARCASA